MEVDKPSSSAGGKEKKRFEVKKVCMSCSPVLSWRIVCARFASALSDRLHLAAHVYVILHDVLTFVALSFVPPLACSGTPWPSGLGVCPSLHSSLLVTLVSSLLVLLFSSFWAWMQEIAADMHTWGCGGAMLGHCRPFACCSCFR